MVYCQIPEIMLMRSRCLPTTLAFELAAEIMQFSMAYSWNMHGHKITESIDDLLN